jgi:hypothetical protein
MRPPLSILLLVVLLTACGGDPPAPVAGETDPVAAWEAFCDQLKATGVEILQEFPQAHAIDRAEAPRYLAQQVAAAVEGTLIDGQTAFPLLRLTASTIGSWGLDGADAKYLQARVEGDGEYRLVGRLGSARLIAIQLFTMRPDYEPFAFLSGDALAPGEDGAFELRISGERPAGWDGPWLPLDPRATTLLVREYFNDWENELPSQLRIERLDEGGGLGRAGDPGALLGAIAETFALRAPMWLERSQQVRRFFENDFYSGGDEENAQGLADNVYGSGWFALEPNEALLITLDAPDALLWSFQLGNFWWESTDYVNGTASLNGHQAVPSSDGRYRVVIALEDPGVPNWLDPAGHTEGAMLYRFQKARNAPEPEVSVVPLAELAGQLPPDTPVVTAEERRREIAARRAHVSRRWEP